MTPLRSLVGIVACSVCLLPGAAHAARAPDVVERTFTFRGKPAQAFARLLQLAPDRPAAVRFELSQGDEHRALPERDAALRDPDGTLSSELGWRASDRIHTTATWDPGAGRLTIEGYVRDMTTAHPTGGGPACVVSSPLFAESQIDRLPGWKALFLALRPLAPRPGQGVVAERRALEAPLDARQHAVVSLVRIDTWDSESRPVKRSAVTIAFGPPLGTAGARCGRR